MTQQEFKLWQLCHYRERLKDATGEAEIKFIQQQLDQLSGKIVTKLVIGIGSLN